MRRFDARLHDARLICPEYTEVNCRRLMLKEIYPDSEKKILKHLKDLQLRLKWGRVEAKLSEIDPSLLLTIAPILSNPE